MHSENSLILHSGYANIRLESYLFTKEVFPDIKLALKPDGIFVMYNYLPVRAHSGAGAPATPRRHFGCAPTVLSLPYQETLKPNLNRLALP